MVKSAYVLWSSAYTFMEVCRQNATLASVLALCFIFDCDCWDAAGVIVLGP